MRRLMTVLAAAIVLPLTACGDRDPTEPAAAVSGRYPLRTINGQNLPFTVQRVGNDSAEVIHGSITFRADSTFSDSVTFRFTIDDEVTIDEDAITGTYRLSGTAVTLTPADGSNAYTLSVSGTTLTQTFDQFALVYRK